jgi:hypothetical protein
MVTILYVAGILTLIIGIIVGIMSGGGFALIILGSAIGSLIFFGLAKTLENQAEILWKLQSILEQTQKPIVYQACNKCGRDYDKDMASCPYCGNKPV